jgi:hypothetical protein
MSSKIWLGVASSNELSKIDQNESWWCLPLTAMPGDRLLLYCPRTASITRQGIFAEAIVTSIVSNSRSENCNCSGYNQGGTRLFYADIRFIERFPQNLTAAMMKNDVALRRAPIVRKNFQGTTFQLDPQTYERIKFLILGLAQA